LRYRYVYWLSFYGYISIIGNINARIISYSWFSYNDTKIAQGRDAAKQVILDNPELAEELEGLIFEELKKEK
jgi:uncharacterized protein YbaA (DUF1428 family)